MEELARVRVVFEDRHVLTRLQRREGLKCCWVLLRPELPTVAALASHLVQNFALHDSCPGGLVLSMDGFVLPPFESTGIFKDKDIVKVRKKGGSPTEVIKISHDANLIEDSEIVGKQSLLLHDKVLAVEEFEKESGGYQSEDEENEGDKPEKATCSENLSSRKTTSKRKKNSDQILGSKRKKTKLASPEKYPVIPMEGADNLHVEQNGTCPSKGGSSQESPSRIGKSANGYATVNKDDGIGKNLVDSTIGKGRLDEVQESCQRNASEPSLHGGMKKFPSRSARRKKAKRQWQRERELANSAKKESNVPDKDMQQTSARSHKVDQNGDDEEIVPIIVRPGHIRFEPLEQSEGESHDALEPLQWSGTTNKKKGQKWGREKNFVYTMNGDNVSPQPAKEMLTSEEGELAADLTEFEKLFPLIRLPKEGDVIAYRLVELSSSWCPELSAFRVGKVSSYDSVSRKIFLTPVPEYPITFNENNDEGSMLQPDLSLYKEDGSLEIEFPTLADVRIFNLDKSNTSAVANGGESSDKVDGKSGFGTRANNEPNKSIAPPAEHEHGGWDEINRALNEKKAELLQKDGGSSRGAKEGTANTSWSYRALRRSAIGPTISLLRARNDL